MNMQKDTILFQNYKALYIFVVCSMVASYEIRASSTNTGKNITSTFKSLYI